MISQLCCHQSLNCGLGWQPVRLSHCPPCLFTGCSGHIDTIRTRHFFGVDINTGNINRFKNILMPQPMVPAQIEGNSLSCCHRSSGGPSRQTRPTQETPILSWDAAQAISGTRVSCRTDPSFQLHVLVRHDKGISIPLLPCAGIRTIHFNPDHAVTHIYRMNSNNQ